MRFIKTTVVGGVIFLIPIIILIIVLGKGLHITGKLATPIAGALPADTIFGPALVHLLAAAILVGVCFFAGLLAKAAVARKLIGSLERNVVSKVPAYALLKTKTQSMLSVDDTEKLTPVVVRFDDSWSIAFEIDRFDGDKVVIFLPGAPDPWSGSVSVVTADRVAALDHPLPSVISAAKALGKGTGALVSGHLPTARAHD